MEGRLLQGHVQRLHNTLGECNLPQSQCISNASVGWGYIHGSFFSFVSIYSWWVHMCFHLSVVRALMGFWWQAFVLKFWSDTEYLYYCSFYGEDIPIKELCDRVARYVHLCTLYWWLRFASFSSPQFVRLLMELYFLFPNISFQKQLCCKTISQTLLEDHETKWVVKHWVGNKPAFPQYVLVLEWRIWICWKVFVWCLIFRFHVNADRLDQQQF
jgi:hypothetical protein